MPLPPRGGLGAPGEAPRALLRSVGHSGSNTSPPASSATSRATDLNGTSLSTLDFLPGTSALHLPLAGMRKEEIVITTWRSYRIRACTLCRPRRQVCMVSSHRILPGTPSALLLISQKGELGHHVLCHMFRVTWLVEAELQCHPLKASHQWFSAPAPSRITGIVRKGANARPSSVAEHPPLNQEVMV